MIKLIKPAITFEDVEPGFREIFESGMFTKGKYSHLLPEKLREYTGAKYAFLATSATTALSASLKALDIRPGDEVIVSDFSFPATVNVVEELGARPIFADVDRDTYNMLPEELERKITPKTKAVIFVCAFGNPQNIFTIREICHSHHLPLIDDAACGIGSSIRGRKVGSIADIACFSFHPRKLLTGGEGGAITTSNDAYGEFFRVKLAHGADVGEDGKLDFVTYGYNYRLPELQCLMLLKQLERLDELVLLRQRIRDAVTERIAPLGYRPQTCGAEIVHNVQSLVYTMPENKDRDGLIAYLRENGVESTIGTYCLSGCSYYREKYHEVQPNALYLQDHTITLPCYEGVDIDSITDQIRKF